MSIFVHHDQRNLQLTLEVQKQATQQATTPAEPFAGKVGTRGDREWGDKPGSVGTLGDREWSDPPSSVSPAQRQVGRAA